MFGSKNNPSPNKRRKKHNEYIEDVNPIKNVKILGSTKMGQGLKKTENQDSYTIMKQFGGDCYFFAVYDGHGSSGKDASQATNDFIITFMEKNEKNKKLQMLKTEQDNENFLRYAFKCCEDNLKQSGIDYNTSGTCANAIFIHQNFIFISNIGDSRSVLFRKTNKEQIALELSYDQTPHRSEERDRIIKSGGKIERMRHDEDFVGPLRVWLDDEGPGIVATRTLGDWQAQHIGMISEPEVQHMALYLKIIFIKFFINPYIEILPKFDKFIVCGSDSVFQVMNSAEVCGFVQQHGEEYGDKIAEKLVEEVHARWQEINKVKKLENQNLIKDVPFMKYGFDDATVVIAFFEYIDELQQEQ